MNCGRCGARVSFDSHLCPSCGASISIICPNCKSENHPNNYTCSHCRRLLEKRWAVSIPAASKEFSRIIADRIIESKRAVEGERKLVTVMFADLADYSQLSSKLESERMYELMEECFGFMTESVLYFGGTVGQPAEKGFLAVFGAPLAYEDHAQRACRAALEIVKQSAKPADRVLKQYGIDLKMLLGLNSGYILVGAVEEDLSMDYSDIASTSDIAYRTKSCAQPGTPYISENTYRLAEGFFDFEESNEILSGIVPSLKLYKLQGEAVSKKAFDVRANRGLSPFVNRKNELNQLREAYEFAASGNLLCISIVAESGIGKSRLLHEFKTSVLDPNARYLELNCLSHAGGIAYHPFIRFLKTTFEVRDTDDNEQVILKVKNGLKSDSAEDREAVPFLLELLAVGDSSINSIGISPDHTKYKIMEALKRILFRHPDPPMVLALEDLHWSDQSSEEFLNYLSSESSDAKALMILTYRPEFFSQSGGILCKEQLKLEPFPEDESIELIRKLFEPNAADRQLVSLILNKTEGVPFFIEEFVRYIKDIKIVELMAGTYRLAADIHDIAIPSTVRDAIMARVDLLPETAKHVLQAASAIEREFPQSLVKKVTGIEDESLTSCFALLQESDLVHRTASGTETKYSFRHALIREVVYEAVVPSGKRSLHSRIGSAIEDLYGSKLNEFYGILADHHLIGENYSKAAEYSRLAAKRARKTASFDDAIDYTRKRVKALEQLPLNEQVKSDLIDAGTSIGLYYTQINNHVEAKKFIDPILEYVDKKGENRRFAQIRTILGTYHCFVEENFDRGLKELSESLRISEKTSDIISSVSGYGWMGIALSANGEFFKAMRYLEKALQINETLNIVWGVSMVKSLMSALVYNFTGQIELGINTCRNALSMAEKSGDPLSKGMACGSLGMSYHYRGRMADAEKYLIEAASLLEKANYYYWEGWTHYFLGATYLETGNYDSAESHHRRSISILKSVNLMPSCVKLNELALAVIRVRSGRTDIDMEKVKSCFNENRFKALQGWMARLIAEIILMLENRYSAEAESWIRTAIAADEAHGMKLHLGRDYAIYANICSLANRRMEAQDNMLKASKIFEHCGAEWDLRNLNSISVH